MLDFLFFFFFSSRRRHTRCLSDWSSDVCSSDLDHIEEFITGERRRPEPDRVLATVMFTDIVGSTQRAAEIEIGRASCRERGESRGGAGRFKKKKMEVGERTIGWMRGAS